MDISSSTVGNTVRLRVEGRVDALEGPKLSAEIARCMDSSSRDLTIDLMDVDFLDSSGLSVLVKSWREQTSHGRRLLLVLPTADRARRVFELTGFDTVFDIVEPDAVDR